MQINLKEVRRNPKSLNTNIEKDLGWFYNFAHEDNKQYSNNPADRRGIRIKCNGKKRSGRKEALLF